MHYHKFVALLLRGDETSSRTVWIPLIVDRCEMNNTIDKHVNDWFKDGWVIKNSFLSVVSEEE